MRIALDTNVLAYAEGVGEPVRCQQAVALVARLMGADVVIPAQVLGELFRVIHGQAGRAAPEARSAILSLADAFMVADSGWTAFQSALDLAADHQLQIWDALILSVAAEQRCRVLVSEDLQDGFTWRGLTVVNPFVVPLSPLLAANLQQ